VISIQIFRYSPVPNHTRTFK